MIKNIFRNCLFFGIAVLFLSCSFLEEKQTGSLVFDMSEVAARAAKSDFNAKDQMEIKLTGDYEAEKAFFIMDEFTDESKTELLVTFPEIPVGSKVKAEATIFRVFTVSGRKDLYAGTSEILEIQEGVNQLPIKLKKISTDVNDIAEYTVQHYKQNIDNDEYTLADTDDMEGKFNFKTEAKAKEYTGFTALSFEDKLINPDGSTVIKIMYDRNLHKVTYDSGVSGATITVPEAGNHRFGATVDVDFALGTRAGYDFAGWKNTATGEVFKSDDKRSFTMGDADVTLTAQWTASSDTRYTVKHLKQNIDDDNYSEVTEDREEKTGVSLELTNASPKTYTGFTAQTVTQKTIAEDSSTIVEIKYDRNTYKVSYEDSVANVDISVPSDTNNYRYGATVTVDFAVGTSTGHTFKGWKDTESGTVYKSGDITSFEIGAGDVTLYAQWEVNTYNIVYNLNGGAWASGYTSTSAYHDSYTYGEPTSLPNVDKVIKSGYGLVGWYEQPDFSDDSITEIASGRTGTITVYAKWEAGVTSYTINHFIQNIDDDDYTEDTDAVQVVSGKSDESTQAAIKVTSHTGFETQPITEKTINGDGSTFVNVYFNRNTYNITYATGLDAAHGIKTDTNTGNLLLPADAPQDIPSNSVNIRYGATVTAGSAPSLTGYEFDYWVDDAGVAGNNTYSAGQTFELPDHDVELTAKWKPKTNVKYVVAYMLQNSADDDYTQDTSVQKAGTTGSTTNASDPSDVKTYSGFVMQNIDEQIIKPEDLSTTVYVYYNRKTYKVVYDKNCGSDTVTGTWPADSTDYRYQADVILPEVSFTRTGYTFAGWTKSANPEASETVYNYDDNAQHKGPMMIPTQETQTTITLYAKWEVETQSTGIDIGFGVNTSTISVSNMSAGVYTATAGYNSYTWTVDGETPAAAYLDASNPNVLTLTSITVPGVYDITLTATKTVGGNTVTHTWTGQYIKS